MTDPFGRAIRDFHRDEQSTPLKRFDGGDVEFEHPIEEFYFESRDPTSEHTAFLEKWLDGPLIDMGAGAGRDALYFGQDIPVVAIEVSEHLVRTMRQRGVENVRLADMFDLRASFGRDRFRSALSVGTQLGLAGSVAGLREFLGDLAYVTSPDATAVLDSYDPRSPELPTQLGYREDPRQGVSGRCFHFGYSGQVGRELVFRFVSPDRLREACQGTGWEPADLQGGVDEGWDQYRMALEKR